MAEKKRSGLSWYPAKKRRSPSPKESAFFSSLSRWGPSPTIVNLNGSGATAAVSMKKSSPFQLLSTHRLPTRISFSPTPYSLRILSRSSDLRTNFFVSMPVGRATILRRSIPLCAKCERMASDVVRIPSDRYL